MLPIVQSKLCVTLILNKKDMFGVVACLLFAGDFQFVVSLQSCCRDSRTLTRVTANSVECLVNIPTHFAAAACCTNIGSGSFSFGTEGSANDKPKQILPLPKSTH